MTGGGVLTDADRSAVEQVLDAFNKHDAELVDAAVADAFVEHAAPLGMPPGKETLRRFVQLFTGAIPDFRFSVDLRVEGDDCVVVLGTAGGTLTGPLLGHEATGRSGCWPEVHVFRASGGQVIEHWDVIDRLAMFGQLGLPV